MGEVLNSMKFIKMYAWEQPFTDAIKGYVHANLAPRLLNFFKLKAQLS